MRHILYPTTHEATLRGLFAQALLATFDEKSEYGDDARNESGNHGDSALNDWAVAFTTSKAQIMCIEVVADEP